MSGCRFECMSSPDTPPRAGAPGSTDLRRSAASDMRAPYLRPAAHRSTLDHMPQAHRSVPSSLFLIIAIALVAACATSADDPLVSESSTSQMSQGASCANDCGCDYGSVCLNHRCSVDFGPFPPCYCASRDCTGGQPLCSQGFCSFTCTSDCDCDFGSVCSAGRCTPDFGPWAFCYCSSRDCADGQTCSGGSCVGGGGGGKGGGSPDQPF
jgi:hypothetical protein